MLGGTLLSDRRRSEGRMSCLEEWRRNRSLGGAFFFFLCVCVIVCVFFCFVFFCFSMVFHMFF